MQIFTNIETDGQGQSFFRPNKFMIASLILGSFAIFSIIFIFPPFIFGGLSIIFAILSKGSEKKLNGLCLTGITSSIFAMLISVFIVVQGIFNFIYVPEYRTTINTQFEQMYGKSLDEVLKQFESGISINQSTP